MGKPLSIKITSIEKIRVKLFIFALFFIPQAFNYRLYFAGIILLGILLFFSFDYRKDFFVLSCLLLFLWLITTTLLRFVLLVSPNIKDLTEIGRIMLPCYILLNSQMLQYFSFNDFVKTLSVILLVDFSITLMEFLYIETYGTPIYEFIKNIYWSEVHALNPSRSKGLTPGPGQHGVIGVFFFIVFLTNYLFNEKNKHRFSLLFVFLSLFICVASLSRTGIVCVFIAFVVASFFYLKTASVKKIGQFSIFICLFLGVVIKFIIDNQAKLVRLFEVVETGLNNASYSARGDIWDNLINKAFVNWGFFLFGWGKNYFGEDGHQTDNEYVFIFLFYGFLFFLVFFFFVFSFMYKFLIKKRTKLASEYCLFILLLIGLIFAIPSAFFFYVQNLCLLTILSIIIYYENKKNLIR